MANKVHWKLLNANSVHFFLYTPLSPPLRMRAPHFGNHWSNGRLIVNDKLERTRKAAVAAFFMVLLMYCILLQGLTPVSTGSVRFVNRARAPRQEWWIRDGTGHRSSTTPGLCQTLPKRNGTWVTVVVLPASKLGENHLKYMNCHKLISRLDITENMLGCALVCSDSVTPP
jgi:hypothetical protein